MEVSPIKNMDTIIHSQQSESRINETTETDFNSKLLDDETLFSSHTVNTLIDLEDNDQNNNQIKIIGRLVITLLLIPPIITIFIKIISTDNL